jgi:hypothetical protein
MENGRAAWQLVLPIVLFVAAISFLTMPGEEYPGDAFAVRAETIVLLNTGKWAVPQETAEPFGPRGQYFYQNARRNWYPKYGVLNTLIYAPALALEKIATGNLESYSHHRLLFLNLLDVLLGAVTAFYLVLLARRYTKSTLIVVVFVLTSLFSTFWWNYLRAQTFEIYHTLFLLAFCYHFVTALGLYRGSGDKRANAHLFGAAIYFGALCLCKTVYVVLLPVSAAILGHAAMSIHSMGAQDRFLPEERRLRLFQQLLFFWLPLGVLLCVLAGANWYKFDSPFATGYTQWEVESKLFKPANLFPALSGFLFSPHQSVFRHFSLLLFALAAWPIFFKKYKVDAVVFALFGLVLLLVNSLYVQWRGEAAYGPRYLLPVLPLVSLPFIKYLEWLTHLSNKVAKSLLVAGTALLLAYSTLLQVSVNTWPFFFCYDLKDVLENRNQSNPAARYLWSHQFGTITRDFLFYKIGCTSRFTDNFLRHLTPPEARKMETLTKSLRGNYYWFPNLLSQDRDAGVEQSPQK